MRPTITHAVQQQAIPSTLDMLTYYLYPLINPSSFEPPMLPSTYINCHNDHSRACCIDAYALCFRISQVVAASFQ